MRRALPLLAWTLMALPAAAQNSFVEITEKALNRLVERLRNPSDTGVHTPSIVSTIGGFEKCEFFGYLDCPSGSGGGIGGPVGDRLPLARCKTVGGTRIVGMGTPVTWAWWVTDAKFELVPGKMRFSATVRHRVGNVWGTKSDTVDATLGFDQATNRLRITIDPFKVPLEHTFEGVTRRVTEVDVARLFGIAVAIHPQQLSVPMPDRTVKNVTAKALQVTPEYHEGRIRAAIDVGFSR